jgi:putative addiction module killer protein
MIKNINKWTIEYWAENDADSPVDTMLDSLTNEQLKSLAKELSLLSCYGNTLRLPHSRTLGKGLFELREGKFGYRIYYTFLKNTVIVLLQGGDKSSQQRDIIVARKRLTKLLGDIPS